MDAADDPARARRAAAVLIRLVLTGAIVVPTCAAIALAVWLHLRG